MFQAKVFAAGKVKDVEVPQTISVDVIGPALPLHLQAITQDENSDDDEEKEETKEKEIEEVEKVEQDDDEEEEDGFGPALPPHMQKRIIGPTLPPNFTVPTNMPDTTQNSKSDKEDDNDDDDDNMGIGPLPPDHPAVRDSYVQMQLEYRAQKVKERFRDKTNPEKNKREEWMVELPPAHAIALGLDSIKRKFKTSQGPDMSDRSMWTDTPADRLRKEKEKEENRFVPSEESNKSKDKKKDNKVEEFTEEKQESLLDIHLRNLKKSKKKAEKEAKQLGLPTRRPFDREVDLQINRLDSAKKQKIFEKASRLNDRFTVGKY